jgi:hypothetical protein
MDNPIILDNIVSMRTGFQQKHAELSSKKEELEKALRLDPENPFMLMQAAEFSCKICEVNVGIAQIEFEVAKEVARKKRDKEGMQNMMEYKEWLKDCKTLLTRAEAKHAACKAKFFDE